MEPKDKRSTRREFLRNGGRAICIAGVGFATGFVYARGGEGDDDKTVWQIDPYKCTQCGKCATECVLTPSAVKCMHAFAMCGYCDLCTGFFEPEPNALNTGAENQLCPVGALKRRFVEEPYFEYEIDESLCFGCARCANGCTAFGNGSLFMQIKHDLCVNCNQCAIAEACPSNAIIRVPAKHPYLLKDEDKDPTG